MNQRKMTVAIVAMTLIAFSVARLAVAFGNRETMAKHSIIEVMEKAHKGDSLLKKITRGEATHEEKVHLLDLYLSLTEHDPPKGDVASWKRFTDALTIGAARAVVGRDDAIDYLKKVTNCGACHKAHK